MSTKLIDIDPLNDSTGSLHGNYTTTRHKLKLCTPDFPIEEHGDFLFLGGEELTVDEIARGLEIYSKREWLEEWCRAIEVIRFARVMKTLLVT